MKRTHNKDTKQYNTKNNGKEELITKKVQVIQKTPINTKKIQNDSLNNSKKNIILHQPEFKMKQQLLKDKTSYIFVA